MKNINTILLFILVIISIMILWFSAGTFLIINNEATRQPYEDKTQVIVMDE